MGGVDIRVAPSRFQARGVFAGDFNLFELRYDLPRVAPRGRVPQRTDVYAVSVRLAPESSEVAMGGRARLMSTQAGQARIYYVPDVDWYAYHSPRHSLEILLTREFLDRVTEDLGARPIEQLGYGAGVVDDAVLTRFAKMALPFVAQPESLDPLWGDQFMWSFATYVGARHGDLATTRPTIGGLSRWQMRAARDMMEASLAEGTTIEALAQLCGVRKSQFAHAFSRSFGVSPYRWMIERRIAKARTMLTSGACIAETALACGFVDQSHLSRAFKRSVGCSPGAWRQTLMA
ncbi:helix-turn-helix domain-containing protein [Caulobacter segnis]|uniref:helix-turn-helix domain-containing protein n=1 Tax=Caulobacter segnis TaxID=88688 RepID=UPI001CBC71E0|nr:AraC family transcriptional regulator [Caulobacter segnis]UAL10155.1 AraC family transcriptional regulator [Caulobacter segnis]